VDLRAICLIAFSPRKAATVLYNLTGFSGSNGLLAKLGKHRTGKSCVYIKKLAHLDQNVLQALLAKSIATQRARYS
jgi:hypothetical protein